MNSPLVRHVAVALAIVSFGFISSCGSDGEDATMKCRETETLCDGVCTALETNADHCGVCDNACPAALLCSHGECIDTCSPGLARCERSCVDLSRDAYHCGSCDAVCLSEEDCVGSHCVARSSTGGASGVDGSDGGTAVGGLSGGGGLPGSGGASGGGGLSGAGGVSGDAGTGGGGAGTSDTGGTGGTGGESAGAGGSGGSAPDPPAATCTPPISLVDTSSPDQVVGSGTSGSCTQQALQSAVSAGGVVTFDCGGPATISIASAIDLPLDRDVTVDGGGEIILDAGRDSGTRARIFEFDSPNYRTLDTTFTVQRITLQNAEVPANDFTPQDTANPRCAYGYKDGQGGAIYVRDGVLHIIDVVFRNNKASTPGPDTGGGGIYALGSKEVIIVGSVFENNEGSNGGGVGLLQSDGIFVNTVFRNNVASGTGANFGGATECGIFNHDQQGGAGGNGAAVAIDGGSVARADFCGVTFEGNQGGALGTVFRTPNSQRETSTFDRCFFDNNHTEDGGSGIYTQDMDLVVINSTFANNTANGIGGAIRLHQGAHGSTLQLTNSTFHRNRVTRALGGALIYDGPGSVTNCTFSENEAIGGYDPTAEAAFFGGAISGGGFSVDNTIFLNNRDTHPYTPMTCNVSSPLAGSNNLQWPRYRIDEDGTPSTIEDDECTIGITWADADLGPLADNGGAAPTLIPSPGSPAIGIGSGCPSFDQRGQARPAVGCASGAVEPN